MAKEFILGRMEDNTKENINMIRNMDSVSIHGMMAENMKECGNMENNMAKVNTFFRMELVKLAYGKMAKG